MPREITHWIAARRAASTLRANNPAVSQALNQQVRAFYLGAIAHDVPYFLNFGRDEQFSELAEVLHGGNGEDTFEPVRLMLSWISSNQNLEAESRTLFLAFAAGMLTHIVVDAVFHPSIFFVTGNYYDSNPQQCTIARRKHREIEVAIDACVSKLEPGLEVRSIASLTKPGPTLNKLSDLLGSLRPLLPQQRLDILAGRSLEATWKRALSDCAICQRVFQSKFAGIIFGKFGSLVGGRIKEYAGLFAGQSSYEPLFASEIVSYKNLVTGETRTDTISQLLDRAVQECQKYLAEWEPLFTSSTSTGHPITIPPLLTVPGPNLSSGIASTKNSDLRFFR